MCSRSSFNKFHSTFRLAGGEGHALPGVEDDEVPLQGHAKEAAAAQGTLAGWALLLVDIDDAGDEISSSST